MHQHKSILFFLILFSSTIQCQEKITVQLTQKNNASALVAYDPSRVAILICDMWNVHWCKDMTRRCTILAKEINQFISIARKKGMTIVHAPSDCMPFYRSFNLPSLPFNDDKPCPDNPSCPIEVYCYRQHPDIEIMPKDIVSDNAQEIENHLKQQGISTIIYTGVHTNICVLHRPFGICMMQKKGFSCILAYDLTDVAYNPEMPPYITIDEANKRMANYVAQNICPITSGKSLFGIM